MSKSFCFAAAASLAAFDVRSASAQAQGTLPPIQRSGRYDDSFITQRKPFKWPGNNTLAVWFAPNVEVWQYNSAFGVGITPNPIRARCELRLESGRVFADAVVIDIPLANSRLGASLQLLHRVYEKTPMTAKIDDASEALYHTQGMGQRLGFGEHPAVLIIDMQHDFCDPDAPTTLWPSIQSTYEPIRELCSAARARRIPVFYTQGLVAADGSSAGLWRLKMRAHANGQVQIVGSKGADIIPELRPEPSDHVIRKWRPSAFFRTDFEVFLNSLQVDTLLICGTSVSGCVRATVTDGFMRDIRCMVVREAVADRTPEVMEANLFDMDQKYADVVSAADALDYLNRFPLRN